jgi:amidase
VAGLHTLPALEIARLVRARELGRREVVAAHLDRIEATNGAVNAIVEVREAALRDAEEADRGHAERADLPLDGVPVSIKEHFDVEGMKHTEGVRAFAERRSPGNAIAVQRLIDAGALVVGKANQPDFQIRWNTVNDLYGATRNPRDLSLSAGGSSGGDAAAVASGMAAVGLGADYGGSIRVPSTFCGIFGLRPTTGRIAQVQPIDALSSPTADLMNSPGPLARTLDDVWAAFRVLAGPDPRDPVSLPVAPPPESGQRCEPAVVARVARETGAIVEPEVEHELDLVCQALESAGYRVVEGGFPGGPRAPELWGELIGPEFIFGAMQVWKDLLGDSNRQHIEEMFGGVFQPKRDIDLWVAGYMERRAVAQATAEWMEEHPLVVCPVAGMPTPPLDFDHYLSAEATRDLFDHMRNIVWVNMLGLPSIALPNGIQIVARRFREHEALSAARAAAGALGPVAVAEAAGG